MSAYDPFDGIYDDGQAGSSNTATSPVEQQQIVPAEDTHYTRGHLEGLRKAELQEIARGRGLDASGNREDLIDRIEAA